MEHTTAYRLNSRCWSNADAGIKPINLYNNGSLSKPSSSHNAYSAQDEETVDASLASGPSSNYSTNWTDSSLFCSPWSTYPDEIKPGPTAQLNTKVQSEKNEYGSEADLYGLVSNILEEQDKSQPYYADGIYSPMLKSLWPLNLNRLSDHQGLLPDLKQDFRGVESVLGTETHRDEDLFYELPGVEQDDRWPRLRQTDNPNSYNINPRIGLNECFLPKNCSSPASMLSETSKDPFQNREPLVSSLSNFNFYTEADRYDLLNNSKSKLSKNSVQGFQEGRSLTNTSNEMTGLDAEVYARLIQAKQSCHKPNDFMADQSFPPTKSTSLISDRSFMSEYDHKSDYARKTPGGGSCVLPNHLSKMTQRCDSQSAYVTKSTTNPDWPLWINGKLHSNSTNSNQNQMKMNSLPASHKGPMLGFSSSSTFSLPEHESNFPSHHSDNPTFPYLQYNCSTDQTNDRFGNAKEERVPEAVSGKRLEPFNGLHENILSRCNTYEDVGNRIYPDKRMQYNAEHLYSECLAQTYHGILGNMANCKNQRLGCSDNKPLTSNKAIHPQAVCPINASMMANMPNSLTSLSNQFQSCLCHKLAACNLPLMDNYVYKELGQTYSGKPGPQCFLSLPMVPPRQEVKENLPTGDLLHRDTSMQNIASMLSSQKSSKLRSRSAAQLHLRLEECYQQCRSLEQDRRKTECVFVETYPGKIVSSVSNIFIQKLPANPTRVDRLIVDQLHEQARVVTLVGKMERYCSTPFHANISTALDRYLETIHAVQARRREEMFNTSRRQKHKRALPQDDREVGALANSVEEMTMATRKARTVLWCALQMTLPVFHEKAHDRG
ncbi:meiosis-specific coiled-coil domain-containing protein MEIOC [Mantella aurantiaca]